MADALAKLMPGLWTTIDYTHAPIPEQLDQHGIRQFELDVFPDPDGGLYATPPRWSSSTCPLPRIRR